ncbi:hypothetical protein O1611_g3231 [Lasiodiplodia mahajangana]|uniref:Uncharacterized protein n=1 Tax=Lasiodiplodia mahajangana TaxID=1108764 RepID=A0ACC2JSC7_9PEZI|nr:hypothetical protein O1611_g3231 [Lasiodiplodia mahajangana]
MAIPKTALITGCSDGGIGSALAVALQKQGYHVFATARDPSKMQALKTLSNVTLLKLDVVKPDDIKAAVEAVSKYTGSDGTLDCLINNAGRNHFMPMLDEDLDTVRGLFEINFFGPIALTQAFAPLLLRAKGMAVYVTSTAGYLNIPYMGTYSASKRSTEIVAETLRLELAPFGVGVLEVVTGAVQSRGQTYFGDFKLPDQSTIESTIASRAQGGDGLPRMETMKYAEAVVGDITNRTVGRVWYGEYADVTKQSTTAAVEQSVMDAQAKLGTGLDTLGQ